MNSRLFCISIAVLLLCFSFTGCKQEEKETANSNLTESSADQTEEGKSDMESCDVNASVNNETANTDVNNETGQDEMKQDTSWEQIKEIKPSEKDLKNRFAGFFNESLGISTYQYGVVSYTIDGGETWTRGTNHSDCIAGLEIIDEKNAFISANYSEVRETNDGGVTWNRKPNFGDMKNEHCRYLSFIDPNTGWIANKKEIGYTTDGGKTWASINVPQGITDISAIWLSSETEGYFLSNDGKLYKTADGGKTWTDRDLGLKGLMILVCPTAVLHIEDEQNFQIAAYLENESEKGYYYYSTSDGGTSWDKKEMIAEAGPGFLHLNRESSLLTISDQADKTIRVYKYVH